MSLSISLASDNEAELWIYNKTKDDYNVEAKGIQIHRTGKKETFDSEKIIKPGDNDHMWWTNAWLNYEEKGIKNPTLKPDIWHSHFTLFVWPIGSNERGNPLSIELVDGMKKSIPKISISINKKLPCHRTTFRPIYEYCDWIITIEPSS